VFGCLAVASCLKINIDHFTVLVDRTPQILLLSPDLNEDFINEKCISITLMPTSQSLGISGPKFVTPQTNGLVANRLHLVASTGGTLYFGDVATKFTQFEKKGSG
jgi:hypothetical protein